MGDYYAYDRDTGLIIPDTSTLKADVQSEFKSALGSNMDLTDATPQGRLIDGEVTARSNVIAYTAGIANQINPDQSGGVFLASLFSLMGGTPYTATPTVFDGRVYGTNGSTSPSGMSIYDSAGNVFNQQTAAVLNQVDTTVTPNTYYGVATFQAAVAGATAVLAGATWFISSTAPSNITKVVNPLAGTTGQAIESDVAARRRRKSTLAAQSSNTVRAIKAGVSALSGYRSMVIRENDDSSVAVIDGISMPANSVYVCVQGALDVDIADAMLTAKGTGAAWTVGQVPRGTPVTTSLIEPSSGQPYTILHARPLIVSCTCVVTYDASQSVGNYEPQYAVQDAINKYQNGLINGDPGLVIGRNLSAYELSGAVSSVYPGLYIADVTVTGKTVVAGQEIPVEMWEQAELPVGSIVVVPRGV